MFHIDFVNYHKKVCEDISLVLEDKSAPSSIRDNNLSQVFRIIHRQGPISRASLVRNTGLSATTISAIISDLLESGFIHEVGEGKSSGGRRPIMLQLEQESKKIIGVDMGAAHIETIISNLYGKVIRKKICKFDVAHHPIKAMDIIKNHIAELMEEEGLLISDILGLGFAVPAPLEGENMDLLSPVILPEWKNIRILNELDTYNKLPIYIENDANAGAMAEKWWGSGGDVKNMVYIKIGTGVGSGLIVENKIYRGAGGTAGEIGHTTINIHGPLCRCGNHGCMESYVGIPGIIKSIYGKFDQYPDTRINQQEPSIEDIILAAKHDDPLALDIVSEAGKNLGIAIANFLNLMNPELVVLGGDLVEAGAPFINAVRKAAFNRSISKAANEVKITTSELKDDVVAIGAATLVVYYAFLPGNIRQTLNLSI